jgi:hypothetical protein
MPARYLCVVRSKKVKRDHSACGDVADGDESRLVVRVIPLLDLDEALR